MTMTDSAPTDVESLVAAARAAVPVLAANAGRADRDRRLPAESIAALRDAGAFALATPARFGGPDADLPTTARVISELGRGCLLDLNGASRFAVDNPLQRFWRDLHVGSRHVQFNPYLAPECHAGALAATEQAQETR
jgi:alkylation response protein AidB-like acyl-CoA dehydrogenase